MESRISSMSSSNSTPLMAAAATRRLAVITGSFGCVCYKSTSNSNHPVLSEFWHNKKSQLRTDKSF